MFVWTYHSPAPLQDKAGSCYVEKGKKKNTADLLLDLIVVTPVIFIFEHYIDYKVDEKYYNEASFNVVKSKNVQHI